MTTSYATHVSARTTPQAEPIPGKAQVRNNAGGFAFAVDDWTRLDRFVILGCEGGSYYATEKAMTKDNAAAVLRCLAADGIRTVERIAALSDAGRAPKNDPAIFALALAASFGDVATKQRVGDLYRKVCRIGTHHFQFIENCKQLRGHGRSLNRTLRRWYLEQDPADLAYQVVKYQQRNKWSHRDVLRLCRPKAAGLTNDVLHWAVKGWENIGEEVHPRPELQMIWAFEKAKRTTDVKEICRLIRAFNLPRECVPTEMLTRAEVWDALLERMPMTAMVRNLATMTRVGLLAPFSDATTRIIATLRDEGRLQKARLHPIQVLSALLTYSSGHGGRGDSQWQPVSQIVDALDAAFYKTFAFVEPTHQRHYLGIDVSGSMDMGQIAGVPGLTPRLGAAAMALVTLASEPQTCCMAFSHTLIPLALSSRQRLDDAIALMRPIPFGRTNCSLPMLDALQRKLPVDVFVVLTDNETWCGDIHPCQALDRYRQTMGIGAKLVVVGMTATQFSIANPNDSGQLDVVGMDTATPALIADFVRGSLAA